MLIFHWTNVGLGGQKGHSAVRFKAKNCDFDKKNNANVEGQIYAKAKKECTALQPEALLSLRC